MTLPKAACRIPLGGSAALTFDFVGALLPTLSAWGIDTVHLPSPFAGVRGRVHERAWTDPTTLDADLGGDAGWTRLHEAAVAADVTLTIDLQPTHLDIADPTRTPAWWSRLREGRRAESAPWFETLDERVHLPVLGPGESADDLLEHGALALADRPGGPVVVRSCGTPLAPIAPGTWRRGPERDVLARQHYDFVEASDTAEIGVRRHLGNPASAALRQHDPAVFTATHAGLRGLTRAEQVNGVVVRGADALVDPERYLIDLRRLVGDRCVWAERSQVSPVQARLPKAWDADGVLTHAPVGQTLQLSLHPDDGVAMRALHERWVHDPLDWSAHVAQSRLEVGHTLLRDEALLVTASVPGLDPDLAVDAVVALAASTTDARPVMRPEMRALERVTERAALRRPLLAGTLADLTPHLLDTDSEVSRRFHQFADALVGVGTELVASTRWTPHVVLNELGVDPERFGWTPAEYHAAQVALLSESAPLRSLDDPRVHQPLLTRSRMSALAELVGGSAPDPGHDAAIEWFAAMHRSRAAVAVSDPSMVHGLAQLWAASDDLGAEALFDRDRQLGRWAGDPRHWPESAPATDGVLRALVDELHAPGPLRRAWDTVRAAVAAPGWHNVLSAVGLHLAGVGVPEVALDAEELGLVGDVPAARPAPSGPLAKLWLTAAVLRARHDRPEAFTTHVPLRPEGERADHVLAADRGGAVLVAARWPVRLAATGWGTTTLELPPGSYRALGSPVELRGVVGVGAVLDGWPFTLLLPT